MIQGMQCTSADSRQRIQWSSNLRGSSSDPGLLLQKQEQEYDQDQDRVFVEQPLALPESANNV